MRKIMALLMIAIIVFHLSIVFNRPPIKFPAVSIRFPTITFKPGIFLPKATLPAASTFKPMVHVHTTFFNLR
jgi:hypothetical protein